MNIDSKIELRGSSVYLLANWLLGSFADECNAYCSSCAHCMGAKLLKIIRKTGNT